MDEHDVPAELAGRWRRSVVLKRDVFSIVERGAFRTGDGEREMRLTLDERRTETLAQLHNLPLWTETGQKVPLASLASFTQAPGADNIQRENRKTSVWVGALTVPVSPFPSAPRVIATAAAGVLSTTERARVLPLPKMAPVPVVPSLNSAETIVPLSSRPEIDPWAEPDGNPLALPGSTSIWNLKTSPGSKCGKVMVRVL